MAKKMKDLKKGVSGKKAADIKGGIDKNANWGHLPTVSRPGGLGAITNQGFRTSK